MSRRLLHIVLVLLLFTSCGYRSQEMSEALARAEEMNRNYQSMDTLKGMEQVADYYRPLLGRSQRYMRALYMLGCVYRDRGDAPMALHYYQEAVSHADTTDADCDFHTLCRCRLRLPYPLPNLWADVCALSAATLPSTRTGG